MTRYRADPDSLAAHPMPAWWRDAKLGVMMHWGLYSVPAWAPREADIIRLLASRPHDALIHTPYAEWYANSLKFADGPTAAHHRATYGDRPYESFRDDFEAGLAKWSAGPLIDFVAGIGARYFVPVTKHHDGYCLWPTTVANPLHGRWRAPRHLVAEMAGACRERGLRFGVYYSGGLDWTYEPAPIASLGAMRASLPTGAAARAAFCDHYRELIAATDPDILWNDIAYPSGEDLWPLLADFYNDREDRLINDRFQLPDDSRARLADPEARAAFDRSVAEAMSKPGFAFAPSLPPVFDHRTPEYASGRDLGETPWETVRGVGHSFGFKANETAEDYLTGEALVRLFVDIVGWGGNLLINIGPRADGSIPDEQGGPLRALGEFVAANGAAIFGGRPDARLPRVTLGETSVHPVTVGPRRFALISGEPPPAGARLEGWGAIEAVRDLSGRPWPSAREGEALTIRPPERGGGGAVPALALELLEGLPA
jgi:alpha-L-fucosidase